MARLTWEVFTSVPLRAWGDDPPPGQQYRLWPPISSTLIAGQRDAVLVDVPVTTAQASALADRVAASRKNLTAIYITHGHPDHWFGISVMLDRFPGARAVAIPAVVRQMRRFLTPDVLPVWHRRFPGQISGNLVVPGELTGRFIDLEGRELVAVEIGHTDMDDTTCLHVPSIGLVAAGDSVYNDVYLHLRESSPATRQEWIAALDAIESLRPAAVVAGHKRPGRADDPSDIVETRSYIRSFEQVLAQEDTALAVYEKMIARYPDRVFPGALWASASGLKR
jgi:glyoxylase-like metal-dependent hydrolase (beta-lactamase superfamily II)